jgi:hypothetical protein
LDAYANGFNRSLGGGWSRAGGNLIQQGLVGTGAMKNSTLANATANQCLAATTAVSIPLGVGIFYGGEFLLGVGPWAAEEGMTLAEWEQVSATFSRLDAYMNYARSLGEGIDYYEWEALTWQANVDLTWAQAMEDLLAGGASGGL